MSPNPSPKWPLTKSSAVSPVPTPTYPTGGLWTILTSTTIEAPPDAVLEATLDTSTWPKWNTFVQRADILSQPPLDSKNASNLKVGTKATFHSKMKETGPTNSSFSDHEVVSIEKIATGRESGWRVVWKTIGIPGGDWTLRAERVQELVEIKLEDGRVGTEYKTWGTFGGPMAYALNWAGTKDDIEARFGDWANDLKAYVEGYREAIGSVER
jgi:hypothetical protein